MSASNPSTNTSITETPTTARFERRLSLLMLVGIIIGYWVVGGLFAIRTPDWQTPDEPAHYNYIAQFADTLRVPLIETGDWDQPYLDQLKGAGFAVELLDDLDEVQYEDHQPPLYYVLATPVYWVTDGNLTALRLFSVFVGTIIVASAAVVGWTMFPERPWIGLATAGFVAFQPMHLHILASVNNDSLGWAIAALTLVLAVQYVKGQKSSSVFRLGLVVGLGMITKATTYMMGGVALTAILLVWWQARDERKFGGLIRDLLVFGVPVAVFALAWWGRNISVYGFPDFLGLAAHDAVVFDQARTAEYIDANGFGTFLSDFMRVTFNSFWAQFGWMAVPLQSSTYTIIRVLLVLTFAGIGLEMVYTRRKMGESTSQSQRYAWILISMTAILSILAYLYYNSEFQQFQGRYMFPILIPLGLWLALGLDGWRRFLLRIWIWVDRADTTVFRIRLSGYLVPMVYGLLAIWDMWLLWRVIVPNL